MKPVEFKHKTKTLTKPKGMTDDQCGDLHVFQKDNTSISCWSASWKERLKILLFGKIWLGVVAGASQPPVYLVTERPFTDDDAFAVHKSISDKQKFISYMADKYGSLAIEKAKQCDASAIPENDLRRSVVVSPEDLIEARQYKLTHMFGMKMVN